MVTFQLLGTHLQRTPVDSQTDASSTERTIVIKKTKSSWLLIGQPIRRLLVRYWLNGLLAESQQGLADCQWHIGKFSQWLSDKYSQWRINMKVYIRRRQHCLTLPWTLFYTIQYLISLPLKLLVFNATIERDWLSLFCYSKLQLQRHHLHQSNSDHFGRIVSIHTYRNCHYRPSSDS